MQVKGEKGSVSIPRQFASELWWNGTAGIGGSKWIILAFFAAGALLAGCQATRKPIAFTVEQAVFRRIPKNAQQVRLLAQGQAPNRNVGIVYEYRLPWSGEPASQEYCLVYREAEWKNELGWDFVYTSFGCTDLYTQVDLPKDYAVYQDSYTAFYGPLPLSSIQNVAVTLANGESISEKVEGKGFLIFWSGKMDVCELHFYGADQQLLEAKTLSRRNPESDECP